LTLLSGLQRILYIACDGVQSIFKLKEIAENYTGKRRTQVEVEEILSPILEGQLMIKDGHSYLSLAIPIGDYKPKKEAFEKFVEYLQAQEMSEQDKSLVERTKVIDLPRDIKISNEEIHRTLKIKRGIILDS
jgi:hypothetical protein